MDGDSSESVLCEIQIFGDAGPVSRKCVEIHFDALPASLEIEVVDIEVEQIDVPRRLDAGPHVGIHNLPCYGKARGLGFVMHIPIASVPQLLHLFTV